MSNIQEVQEEIVNEFIIFDDWMDRYNYLIELANDLPMIDEKKRNPEHVIQGCQSKVWLDADYHEGRIIFTADSDAIITKGIIALLVRVLSKRTPQEVMNTELDFIDKIGLKQNLSPTRANGLVAMIKQMRLYAIAYDAREKNKN